MFPFPSSGLSLRSRLTAVAVVASLGGSALALPLAALAQPLGQGGRNRPTPAQLETIFPPFRALQLQDRRARIANMQSAERCMLAARKAAALQSCMKQERTAAMAQRQEHYSALRQLFERNGLPLPEMGRAGRGSRPGRPAPAPGAPAPGTPGAGAPGAGVQL